jgi:NADPH:quinone reductase-like Zn-dependent oxidoreductase
MKAARINEWAKPVQIEDQPQPEPKGGQVLIKVHAASINPIDRIIAMGHMSSMFTAPLTLGTDFAGEVVAVGDGVNHVKAGDAVYGMSLSRGTFAEYAAVDGAGVALQPRSLDAITAAAVPLAGLTAWQTLFNLANLQSGERIIIHGAGGGIGLFAVQTAKDKGAYVIGNDLSDKAAAIRALGADEILDSGAQRFEDVAGPIDVILDLVGGEYVERSLDTLRPGGRYVTSAAQIAPDAGQSRGVQATGTFTQPTVDELAKIAEMIDGGRLKVFVNRSFPLSEIQTALFYQVPTSETGKVVVKIG